jgi:hypothetical protein
LDVKDAWVVIDSDNGFTYGPFTKEEALELEATEVAYFNKYPGRWTPSVAKPLSSYLESPDTMRGIAKETQSKLDEED